MQLIFALYINNQWRLLQASAVRILKMASRLLCFKNLLSGEDSSKVQLFLSRVLFSVALMLKLDHQLVLNWQCVLALFWLSQNTAELCAVVRLWVGVILPVDFLLLCFSFFFKAVAAAVCTALISENEIMKPLRCYKKCVAKYASSFPELSLV